MSTINTFFVATCMTILLLSGCAKRSSEDGSVSGIKTAKVSTFRSDVDFLRRFADIHMLEEPSGNGKVAVCAALQGRVMTSTSEGDDGLSYGWINREAFLSGDTSEHINVFGGEDRFWLGPEGGQFSIYFEKGKDFNLENWHVPKLIDLEPFHFVSVSPAEALFTKDAELDNYSGTVFTIGIERKVKIFEKEEALTKLGLESANEVSLVAFETMNTLKNKGKTAWRKPTGLLSIWILGMFNPSENTTVIIPYQQRNNDVNPVVNDTYFGKVPEDRLKVDDKVIYFKGDGRHRSKIGLSVENAEAWLGSYDADNELLTIVNYTSPEGAKDYVNSMWEIQKEPYRGDVINAYNDGPPSPGAKPLGPFYELESSSPAVELEPEESITHVHTTFHLQGTPEQLDPIMFKLFGITTKNVMQAFTKK